MAQEQDGQEKTEEPTARKLEKARQDGQVARSRELSSVALVTFGAVAATAMMPYMSQELLELTRLFFEQAAHLDKPLLNVVSDAAWGGLSIALPLLVVLFVAGALSTVAMGGFLLSAKAIQPKFNRMSPLKGFKRMFSARSAVELGKSIAKFLLVSSVSVAVLAATLGDMLVLGNLPVEP